MGDPSARWSAVPVVAGLVALAALAYGLWRAQRLPEGPQPIAWDRETCAQCGMHISDPFFAAQLQTTDHEVFDFDDPGDLFLFLADRRPPVHAIWLHHCREERWLAKDRVAFVPVAATPMGHGLGVVDAGTPGALPWDEAQARVLRARKSPPRASPDGAAP